MNKVLIPLLKERNLMNNKISDKTFDNINNFTTIKILRLNKKIINVLVKFMRLPKKKFL